MARARSPGLTSARPVQYSAGAATAHESRPVIMPSTLPAAEPIAVVGIGCRFPGGASSPARLWDLLRSGRDAVIDIPEERWSAKRFYSADAAAPGKMYVRRAALLQEPIREFDPLFFGISPREACYMDPQQ